MKHYTEAERAALLAEIKYNRENCFCSDKTLELFSVAESALTTPPVAALNPVVLPKSERLNGNGYGYYFDMNDVFEALDSAGVQYEVNATAPAEEKK